MKSIGDRVSMQHVADRYPGTIVGMRGGILLVRRDTAEPTPGSEPMSNDWVISENPDGMVQEYTRRKDGSYRAKGSSFPVLVPGWSHYYSYEF